MWWEGEGEREIGGAWAPCGDSSRHPLWPLSPFLPYPEDWGEVSEMLALVPNLRGARNLRNQDKRDFNMTFKNKN